MDEIGRFTTLIGRLTSFHSVSRHQPLSLAMTIGGWANYPLLFLYFFGGEGVRGDRKGCRICIYSNFCSYGIGLNIVFSWRGDGPWSHIFSWATAELDIVNLKFISRCINLFDDTCDGDTSCGRSSWSNILFGTCIFCLIYELRRDDAEHDDTKYDSQVHIYFWGISWRIHHMKIV